MQRRYFDNAATTFPKPPSVLAAMTHYFTSLGSSPGRGGYAESIQAGQLLTDCRRAISKLFNGEGGPEQVIFTLNCSDALNLAIKGLVDPTLPAATQHAICTDLDHNSILRPLNAMADAGCLTVTRVPVDSVTGLVDPEDIRRAIRPTTKLIAITHASNVTGTVQPLRAVGQIAQSHGIPFVVDAAQSAGHVPIDVRADGVDLLAAPGHKFLLGPLGTGFLYLRPGLEKTLRPLKEGGTGSVSEHDRQPEFLPDKYESGSHNAPGLIGLLEGVRYLAKETVAKLHAHDKALTQIFLDAIASIEGLTLLGPPTAESRIGVFSIRIDGYTPHELSSILETSYGLLTRSGLHCAPHAHRTIGTLETGGTTRLSFGPFLTVGDVHYAARALAEVAASVAAMR